MVDCINKFLLFVEVCEWMGFLKFNFIFLECVNMVENRVDFFFIKEKILSSYKDVFDGLGYIGNFLLVIVDNIKLI